MRIRSRVARKPGLIAMPFLNAALRPSLPRHFSAADDRPILLVEDDAQIRLVLAECLEDDGFDVVQAMDAEEAAEILAQGLQPGLIVTDINLGPGRNGVMLADDVHATHPWMPVVFITGRLDMLRDRGLRAQEFVVPKPFPMQALLGVVRRFMAAPAHRRLLETA